LFELEGKLQVNDPMGIGLPLFNTPFQNWSISSKDYDKETKTQGEE
jgi:hypothetical protein